MADGFDWLAEFVSRFELPFWQDLHEFVGECFLRVFYDKVFRGLAMLVDIEGDLRKPFANAAVVGPTWIKRFDTLAHRNRFFAMALLGVGG